MVLKEIDNHKIHLSSGGRTGKRSDTGINESGMKAAADIDGLLDHQWGDDVLCNLETMKMLLENIPNPIFISDLDSSIIYVNPALLKLCGFSRTELNGCKIPYPWWPGEKIRNYQQHATEGIGKDLNVLERAFIKKNGELFWTNVKIKAISRDNKVRYYIGIWEDLTEKKLAEKKVKESETNYSNLFKSMVQGVIYFDRQGNLISANPAACKILGLELEEMLGQNIKDSKWILQDQSGFELKDQDHPFFQVMASGKEVKNVRLMVRNPANQNERWLNIDAVPEFLPGEKEKPYRVFVTLRDITGPVEAEMKVTAAAREWKDTFDSIDDLVSIHDTHSHIIKVNRALAKVFNKRPEEMVGMACYGQIHGTDCPVSECPHQKTLLTGKPARAELFEPRLGLYLDVSTSPIFDSKGNIKGSVHIARDVTQRKETERRLAEVRDFNSHILVNAPFPVMVLSAENDIQFVNPAFSKLTGFSEKEILGATPPFPYWPEDKRDLYGAVLKNDKFASCERQFRKKDGELFWVKLTSKIFEEKGIIKYVLVSWTDITELKLANQSLVESESKFRVLAEQSTNMIFINKAGRVVYANKKCEELTGYSKADFYSPDFDFLSIIAPNYRDSIAPNYHSHTDGLDIEPFEYEITDRNGRSIPVLYSSKLITYDGGQAILGTIVDISERKRAEEQLRFREHLYRSLFENMLNGFSYCQIISENNQPTDFIYRAVNKAFSLHTGLTDVVGKKVSEVIPGIQETNKELLQTYSRVASSGIPEKCESYIPGLGMWFAISIYSPEKGYFVSVFDVITERKLAQEKLKNSYEKVRTALEGSISIAAKMVEMRDPYTAGHQKRVAKLSVAIAADMGLPEEKIAYLDLAARVHDIGKIHVPAEILSKTGRLTDLEFQMMKTHAQGGFDILNGVDFPWPLAQIVVQHHEKLNGSGYPNGLKGEEILLEAKIISVADTVEAMSGHRPYRPSLGMAEAMSEIARNKGILYDAEVVNACVNLVKNKGFRFGNE
jgi:PAS domain S-box-containing protein